ncbi:MAG TPA: hypothetical protein VMB21_13015 [Candidatus Limnocylindria bacterium]|nr:hypothetical protein [Candidatus Limnocylindria bacterium]
MVALLFHGLSANVQAEAVPVRSQALSLYGKMSFRRLDASDQVIEQRDSEIRSTLAPTQWAMHVHQTLNSANPNPNQEAHYWDGQYYSFTSEPSNSLVTVAYIWKRRPFEAFANIDQLFFWLSFVAPSYPDGLTRQRACEALAIQPYERCPLLVSRWESPPDRNDRVTSCTLTNICIQGTGRSGPQGITIRMSFAGWTNLNGYDLPAHSEYEIIVKTAGTGGKPNAPQPVLVTADLLSVTTTEIQNIVPMTQTNVLVVDYRFSELTSPWALEYGLSNGFSIPNATNLIIVNAKNDFLRKKKAYDDENRFWIKPREIWKKVLRLLNSP